MTARPIRYQRQVSDRNGKIFYTSITSLSHISKIAGHETAHGGRRRGAHRRHSRTPAQGPVRLIARTNPSRRPPLGAGAAGKEGKAHWI